LRDQTSKGGKSNQKKVLKKGAPWTERIGEKKQSANPEE